MIKLPRKLIYQDRMDVKDYIVGNKLNDAIYKYLDYELSLLKDPRFGRKMVDSQYRDEYILKFFNGAYYYCILAACDNRALEYFKDEKDEYVRQVTLVTLSLLQDKNNLVEGFIKRYQGDIKPSYQTIIEQFRVQDITFRMILTPRLPDLDAPSVDWKELTSNFNKNVIPDVIGLWNDKGKKCKVCSNIWEAFKSSPQYGMPHIDLDDNFFEGLMETLSAPEEAEMKDSPVVHTSDDSECAWVRKVVDYAMEHCDWTEAEPMHKMLLYLFRGSSNLVVFRMIDELEKHFNKRMKRKVFLFGDAESNKKEAERFKLFLKEQNIDMEVTSGMSNAINKSFVALCRYRGLDKTPNGNACYRFLKDDCGLEFNVNEKTYGNFIRDSIKEALNCSLDDMPNLIKKAYKEI